MKVDVAVLGSPSLMVPMVSGRKATLKNRSEELCERCPGLPVPNRPDGLCGETFEETPCQ